MWRKYFNIKGIEPGVVDYPEPFNRVDFRSDNLDPEKLFKIYEAGHPYLQITDAGLDRFCPDKDKTVTETVTTVPQTDEIEYKKPQNGSYFKATDLVKLINESKTEEEARYYLGLGKKYSSVQKAYDKRINELRSSTSSE